MLFVAAGSGSVVTICTDRPSPSTSHGGGEGSSAGSFTSSLTGSSIGPSLAPATESDDDAIFWTKVRVCSSSKCLDRPITDTVNVDGRIHACTHLSPLHPLQKMRDE